MPINQFQNALPDQRRQQMAQMLMRGAPQSAMPPGQAPSFAGAGQVGKTVQNGFDQGWKSVDEGMRDARTARPTPISSGTSYEPPGQPMNIQPQGQPPQAPQQTADLAALLQQPQQQPAPFQSALDPNQMDPEQLRQLGYYPW